MKQGFSVFMTFIILIQVSGCYATRTVKPTNLTNLPDQFKYNYIIHTDSSKFQIFSVSMFEGKLSGMKASFNPLGGQSVHIFLTPGYTFKSDPTRSFTVSIEDISKIEIRESNAAGTIVLGFFGLIAVMGIIGLLTFHINAGWNGI